MKYPNTLALPRPQEVECPSCGSEDTQMEIEWADRSISIQGGWLTVECNCYECRYAWQQEYPVRFAKEVDQ